MFACRVFRLHGRNSYIPRSRLDFGYAYDVLQNIQLDEVSVTVNRNVFTTNKQSLYPSEQQIKSSGSGLDLLQKLPIPLLNINPINRTISSWDPSGGVAVLINDIPAEANDVAIIDPKTIKRVEVIRKPGMEYVPIYPWLLIL